MTKFYVYEESNKGIDREPKVFLRFEQQTFGVMVVAVDEYGNTLPKGSLVLFTQEGVLELFSGVSVPGIKTKGGEEYIQTSPPLKDD